MLLTHRRHPAAALRRRGRRGVPAPGVAAVLPHAARCRVSFPAGRRRGALRRGRRRAPACAALSPAWRQGRGLLPSRQRRQQRLVADRHDVLSAHRLRPVPARLSRLRQEHRAHQLGSATARRREAAWNAIAPEYAGRRKIIYGRSLGSGPADAAGDAASTPICWCWSRRTAACANWPSEHYAWVPRRVAALPVADARVVAAVRCR